MLAPKIVVTEKGISAYMVKQKPMPLNQNDIDTLAQRLGLEGDEVDHEVLDDLIEDQGGSTHPARRLTVIKSGVAHRKPEYSTKANDKKKLSDLKVKKPAKAKPKKHKRKAAKKVDPLVERAD